MKMKTLAVAVATAMAAAVAWTGLADGVTNVHGKQRENSRLVDIYYDLDGFGDSYWIAVRIEGRTNAVASATFTGDVGSGIEPGKNHHIVWDAGRDWPYRKGDVRAVLTATRQDGNHDKVQLWEDGPYWATTNIGASMPMDFGLHFWWGDTVGYWHDDGGWSASDGSSSNFSFDESNVPTSGKSIVTLYSEGWIITKDDTPILAPEHDAAQVKWGGSWRMPTKQEFDNLLSNCDWTWTTTENGVKGYVVRGRGDYALNSIFLPATGYGHGTSFSHSGSYGNYWSSVPDSNYSGSWYLSFDSSGHRTDSYDNRRFGFSVRPVQGFTK